MPQLKAFGVTCAVPAGGGPGAPEKQPAPPGDINHPCNLITSTNFPRGLPLPLDPDFCDSISDIADGLERAYDTVSEWLQSLDPLSSVAKMLKIPIVGDTASTISDAFATAWNALMDGIAGPSAMVLRLIKNIVNVVLDVYKCMLNRCRPKALMGLWILRQLIHALDKVRVGTDLAVWFTVDVSAEFGLLGEYLDKLEHYLCPREVPGPEAATRAWLLKRISLEQRDCIWRIHGLDPVNYAAYALVDREQLEWREAIQYSRRKPELGLVEDDLLEQRGFAEAKDRAMASEMYWELPTIQDHLQWLQRNVFDTDYVQRYQLLDGFAPQGTINGIPQFATYTVGPLAPDRNFWEAFGGDLTALGMRQVYAAYHYAAHWVMPSPEQMKEFVYRSKEIQAATGQPFTVADFKRILAEQDYNPLAREWFASTVYNVPAISYVKAMFQQSVITLDELTEYHARLGYAPADAQRFAAIDELQKARMRTAAYHGWTTAAASNAFAAGQMTADAHRDIYQHLGYTEAEAAEARQAATTALTVRVVTRARTRAGSAVTTVLTKAIKVGTMTPADASKQLQKLGWPKNLADGWTQAIDADQRIDWVKQAVDFVQKAFVGGMIPTLQARALLIQIGLIPARVDQYMALWQRKMSPARKGLSAQKISGAVARGILTPAQGIARLENLGYTDADARIYLADAQSQLAKANASRQAASDKKFAARQKALAASAKAADTIRRKAVKAMISDMPVGKLEKWLKLGLVSRSTFRERMTLYGYSPTSIAEREREVCAAKTAACTDTQIDPLAGQGSGSKGK